MFSRRADRALSLFLLLPLFSACRGAEPAAAESQPPPAVSVRVAPVDARSVPVIIEATGSFAALESSDVAPEASGRVIATPVDVGQFVPRGGVLVRLRAVDASLRREEAQAAVSRAEASVRLAESQNELAQTTAQRYANLLATGDVSRTVADQARTEAETQLQNVATARATLEQSRVQLALAERALGDVTVTAPFSGFISSRQVAVGEYVQPSTPIVTLLELDPLRLNLTIPGVQASRVAVGQRVTATVDAFPDRTFEGTVQAVNPAIDPQSRSFTAEARVRNPGALLKPGMFAVARIDQGRSEQALFVPKSAVSEDVNTDSFRVFVIDDEGRARLRVVQPAARTDGDPVRLEAGVAAGERVAVSGINDLLDGSKVTYAEAR